MITGHVLVLYTLLCTATVCVTSQVTNNVKDSKGRQGLWKVWLTRGFEESTDTTIAPYYRIVTYTNDVEAGNFTDYYRSGKLFRKGVLLRDGNSSKIDGIVEVYRETGSIESKETYHAGRRTGPYTKFSPTGVRILEGEFDEDRRVGEWTTYYESGSVKSRGRYVDNNQDGEWITYFEDGKIKESMLFADGTSMNWSALLGLSESACTPERINDAVRYWDQARTAVIRSMGPRSLPAGRLHLVRSRISWVQGNESSSIQHLDTAMQIYREAGPSGRTAHNEALKKMIDFAHEQHSSTLLIRLRPDLIEVMDRDSSLDYETCKRLLVSSISSNQTLRDKPLHRLHVSWASKRLPPLALVKDSMYTAEMYVIWSELLASSYFMKEWALQALCRREAESLPDLESNSLVKEARIVFACTRAMDIIADSVTSWEDKKRRIGKLLDENPTGQGRYYGLELTTVIVYGMEMKDTAFVHSVLDVVSMNAQNIPARLKQTLESYFVWLYLSERNCDSARKHFNLASSYGEAGASQSFYKQYKEALDNCGRVEPAHDLPVVRSLTPTTGIVKSLSLEDVLSTVLPSKASAFSIAVSERATSGQRLTALLLADSTSDLPSIDEYTLRYARIRDMMRPLVMKKTQPLQKAAVLFRALHDSVLTKYIEIVPFRSVFENGHYNCASAVAVYSLLCIDFGIPITYYKAPGHIACGIPDKNNSVVTVELTSPVDGFGFAKKRDSLIAHLLSFKLIAQEELDSIGADSLYRQYYAHSQKLSFGSVLSAICANSAYRASEEVEFVDEPIYESIIASIILDSSDIDGSFLYPLISIVLDSVLPSRFVRDTRYMAEYFDGNEKFSGLVLPSLAACGVALHDRGEDQSIEETFQTFIDHAKRDSASHQIRRMIESIYAAYRLGIALSDGHADTAYAYYKAFLSDSIYSYTPALNGVVRAYADACLENQQYSAALAAVEERFAKTSTASAREDLVHVSSLVLQSGYVGEIDSTQYHRIVRQFMKEYMNSRPPEDDQKNQVRRIVSTSVFHARHELGSIAITEARLSGVAKADLRGIEDVHRVMLQNRARHTSVDDVKFSMELLLGDSDGPVTSYIPSDNTKVSISIKAEGLEPGQQFHLKAVITSQDERETILVDTEVGADDIVEYFVKTFSAERSSLSKSARITIYANGNRVLTKEFAVR